MVIKRAKLRRAFNDFVDKMGGRIADREEMGYSGWDGDKPSNWAMTTAMQDDIMEPGKMVDVAVRAMMLDYRQRKTPNTAEDSQNVNQQLKAKICSTWICDYCTDKVTCMSGRKNNPDGFPCFNGRKLTAVE